MTKKLLPIIIAIIVVGAAAFYGGMKYGQSKSSSVGPLSLNGRNFQANMAGRKNGPQAGAGFVSGEIISKDDESVTVKLMDAGSKIVFYSNTTKVAKSAEGSADDLVVGEQIQVSGTTNQDGSITAQSIQLRPIK